MQESAFMKNTQDNLFLILCVATMICWAEEGEIAFKDYTGIPNIRVAGYHLDAFTVTKVGECATGCLGEPLCTAFNVISQTGSDVISCELKGIPQEVVTQCGLPHVADVHSTLFGDSSILIPALV